MPAGTTTRRAARPATLRARSPGVVATSMPSRQPDMRNTAPWPSVPWYSASKSTPLWKRMAIWTTAMRMMAPATRRAARIPPARQQRDEQDRPDHVELLLDRQRPQVLQRERGAEHVGPVEDVAEGQPDRSQHVADRRTETGRGDEQRHRAHDAKRRQQPGRPPGVEAAETDVADAMALLEEQPGDQEPAQEEEEVDTEEPALEPSEEVEGDDGDDGDGSQPVELGAVAHAHTTVDLGLGRRSFPGRGRAGARSKGGEKHRSWPILGGGVDDGAVRRQSGVSCPNVQPHP